MAACVVGRPASEAYCHDVHCESDTSCAAHCCADRQKQGGYIKWGQVEFGVPVWALRVTANTLDAISCPRRDSKTVHQVSLSKSLISESMEKLSMKFPAVACAAPCARWGRRASSLVLRSSIARRA